ncbi:hypothetical protein [Pseudoalteromonas ruthenica]|nr:hypothetical protein [Pseudoalteromonas ruthenica]KJY95780.1 hypothetical protein TW76_14515 [Pseudoalteromonas ruthenica]TMO90143.1 hypothetical protein CWC12_01380 [Pseudoalteromonas ruthenica]TMP01035.1 hypothetical protein CWC07_01565 [Pseudoalteromonas ruthenica]TMP25848.1 hypothetical protein CWC06_01710 [Pseudoalteromonas ruthenica]
MPALTSLAESISLHRAIVQAKFGELEPFDSSIPFSEPLSNVAKRNIAAIVSHLIEEGEHVEAKLWEETQKLRTDWDGYEFIVSRIQSTENWLNYSDEEKAEFVEILCSPFSPSTEQMAKLLRIGNET